MNMMDFVLGLWKADMFRQDQELELKLANELENSLKQMTSLPDT